MFQSTAANQFRVRCTGGAAFVSAIDGNANPTAGVTLAAGGNSWGWISDRNVKENFREVDGRDVLEKLERVPVSEWNLKAQDPSIRHIGPMAQDFHEAFGLGESDRHINGSDLAGVTVAAVQGLYRLVREKDEQIAELRARLAALEADRSHARD
jgi:hypothetical protein